VSTKRCERCEKSGPCDGCRDSELRVRITDYAGSMPPTPPTPKWRVDDLRLPKTLDTDPRLPALRSALKASARMLWDGGVIDVPVAAWNAEVAAALGDAEREGHLVRGLELVEKTLDREARGLALVDARSGTERGSRVSRLMLLSEDGTERFYRQAERLIAKQGSRLLALRLEAGSSQLAGLVPQASGVVRALLVEHKDSVARVLLALYP